MSRVVVAAVAVVVVVAGLAVGCGRRMERAVQVSLDGDPLAAYGGGFDPERHDAGVLAEADAALLGRPLVFVVPSFYAPEINKGAAQDLQTWLAARIGVPVEIRAADAYGHEALVLGLSNGTIDVADVAPYTYALVEERGIGAIPLVATVARGSSTYGSYLVVRRGSRIHALDDLKGKRLAFVEMCIRDSARSAPASGRPGT